MISIGLCSNNVAVVNLFLLLPSISGIAMQCEIGGKTNLMWHSVVPIEIRVFANKKVFTNHPLVYDCVSLDYVDVSYQYDYVWFVLIILYAGHEFWVVAMHLI
jgi:hypothetical protein